MSKARERGWYLVSDPQGREILVTVYIGTAMDAAFEAGKGSTVDRIADRGGIPEHGSEPRYVAEEREYMIRTPSGLDYLHAPGLTACMKVAENQLGKGATVHRLDRNLLETGIIEYTVK